MPSPVYQDAIIFVVNLSVWRGPVVLMNVLMLCFSQLGFLLDEDHFPNAIIVLIFAQTLILLVDFKTSSVASF